MRQDDEHGDLPQVRALTPAVRAGHDGEVKRRGEVGGVCDVVHARELLQHRVPSGFDRERALAVAEHRPDVRPFAGHDPDGEGAQDVEQRERGRERAQRSEIGSDVRDDGFNRGGAPSHRLVGGVHAPSVDDVEAVARAPHDAVVSNTGVVVGDGTPRHPRVVAEGVDRVQRRERRVEVGRVHGVPAEIGPGHLDLEHPGRGVIEPGGFQAGALAKGAYELVRSLGGFAKVPSGDVQKRIHA